MKRIIFELMCIVIAFSLCACGSSSDKNNVSTAAENNTEQTSTDSAQQDTTDASEKAEANPSDEAKKLSENWGNDEFTALIPQPDFGDFNDMTVKSTGIYADYLNCTYAQAYAYYESMLKLGFSHNTSGKVSEDDTMFMWYGKNEANTYCVTLGYVPAQGEFAIMVDKVSE